MIKKNKSKNKKKFNDDEQMEKSEMGKHKMPNGHMMKNSEMKKKMDSMIGYRKSIKRRIK